MNRRQSREVHRARTSARLPAATIVVAALATAGCGGADVSRPDAASAKTHVLALSHELLGALTSVGSFGKPPRAGWSGCDDLGGKVAYRVAGRIDPPHGLRDTGLLDAVRSRLAAHGARLRDVSGPGDVPRTLQGTINHVQVQVTGYPDRSSVLLSLVGPCLDVGHADHDLLAEPPERLDLG